MRLSPILLFAVFSSLARAEKLDITPRIDDDQCIQGCMQPLNMVSFGDIRPKSKAAPGRCASTWYTTSLLNCAVKYCDQNQVVDGWQTFVASCKGYNVSLDSLDEAKAGLPSTIPVVDCVKTKGTVYNSTIEPTAHNVEIGIKTVYTWDRVYFYHHAFGWSLWILCGLMAVGGLALRFFHWITWYPLESGSPSCRSDMAPPRGRLSRFYTAYRKRFGTPALFGHKHGQPAWWLFSVPTRLQAFWIFVYVALNVIFCCVGYSAFDENMKYPGRKDLQILKYVADRTGIMAWYNLPMVWLLAGRNDFLLWITGCSYKTLNTFHRWVARITVLQALVHSVLYIYMARKALAASWEKLFWKAGAFAIVVVCLMVPLTMLPIRQKAYEVFLILHIVMAVAVLVLCYYHVTYQQGQYDPWIWACVSIWAFDRVVRWLRLSVLSYNAFTSTNAEAIVTGGENGLIRLTVTTPFKVHPTPGQYYFLYNPTSLTPWENHPFTLASWDQEHGSTRLHFLIAVQDGATRRLRRKITESPTKMRVLVEGPYGQTEPVERFEHVVFIAGGSGVTSVLPYLDRLRHNRFTRSVSLVWSVKNNAYTTDVLHKELHDTGAQVIIHVTEEEQPAAEVLPAIDEAAHEENKEREAEVNRSSFSTSSSTNEKMAITVSVGRPNMRDILRQHTDRLVGAEKLAVVACGPGAMMDDLRRAVVDSYGDGEGQVAGSRLEYFEELFGW